MGDGWPVLFLLIRDQLRMLTRDNVVASGALGLAKPGVTPTAAEQIVPAHPRRYRAGGGRRETPRAA